MGKERWQMIGVYKITNTVNGKVYIGSTTIDIETRWGVHRSALRTGKHYNKHLQRAWNRYGESAFTFEVIEQGTTKEDVRSKERSWIQKFFGVNCYNATTEAAGRARTQSPVSQQEIDNFVKNIKGEFTEDEFIGLIRGLVEKFGTKQRLAEYLEVSPSSLGLVLSRKIRPPKRTLEKLGYRRVIAFKPIGESIAPDGYKWKKVR
jgi:group I intron endonuclease